MKGRKVMKKRFFAFLCVIAMVAGLTTSLGKVQISAAELDTVDDVQAEVENGEDTNAGPTIVTQPQDVMIGLNKTATFTVVVSETNVTYQWQTSKDSGRTWLNSSLTGYNKATLSVVADAGRDGYQFRCKISDQYGYTTTSNAARLSVTGTFAITTQPTDATVKVGETAVFSLTATGVGLSYQWQASKDGGNTWLNSSLPGYNTNKLSVSAIKDRNGYKFRCVVSDKNGAKVTSYAVTLTVTSDDVKITSHPSDVQTTAGANVTFKVVASGTGLKYQWQTSKDGGNTWVNSSLSGYNKDTLTVQATNERNGYYFRCVVRDQYGSTATSFGAKLTITSSSLKITSQPADASANIGDTVKFTVGASGTGLKYQWQTSKDGGSTWSNSSLTGYNTATLSLQATAERNGYKFRCIVSDKTGAKVTSNAATLTVGSSTVTITSQPADVSTSAGTTVTFTVGASGTGLTYQWQTSKDGGNTWLNSGMTGYNTKTLTVSAIIERNGYKFRCVVTDKFGTKAASKAATLTVKAETTTKITEATVDGTNVKLTWTEVKGATYTVLYAKGNNTLTQLATKISSTTYTVKGLDPDTTYRFAVYATVNGTAGSQSPAVTVTTESASGDVTYRAVLIGEENFTPVCTRNRGDVELMKEMLVSVNGGTGERYSVINDYYNLDYYGVGDAIAETFAGADDNDVSLFFIATHGDVSHTGAAAGSLALVDDYGNDDYIHIYELEKYLSEIPGKVIVILESCGSGAAVYDPEVPENSIEKDIEFTNSVIETFSSADPGYSETKTYYFDAEGKDITLEVNTGEFRQSKYYVLTASRYQEYSWGSEYYRCNFFTKWLVEGIGSDYDYEYMPADYNGDKKLTINEAHSYVKEINDSYSFYSGGSYYYQHSQVYPENSDFVLFAMSDLCIIEQPEDVYSAPGENVEFYVGAKGSGLSYQWQTSKDGGSTWTNSSLTGYNTDTLRIVASTDRNGYMFRCIVKNSAGQQMISDAAKLKVEKTRYRALLVANNYAGTESEILAPSNNADALYGTLNNLDMFKTITVKKEISANGILNSISDAFGDAKSDDVSLFYFAGHGVESEYTSYLGALCGYTGSGLDYLLLDNLAGKLSNVPGKVIIMLDSCYSGAAIGKDIGTDASEEFNKRVLEAFSGYKMDGTRSDDVSNWQDFTDSKFIVLTAATYSKSSWMIWHEDLGWYTWRGLFSNALIEALGGTYPSGDYIGSVPADVNGDNKISLGELYDYIVTSVKTITDWWNDHYHVSPGDEYYIEYSEPQYYGDTSYIVFKK